MKKSRDASALCHGPAMGFSNCGHAGIRGLFLVIAPVGGGRAVSCPIVALKTLVGNASTHTQLFAPQAWQGGLVVSSTSSKGTSWARFWPFSTGPSCAYALASLDFLFLPNMAGISSNHVDVAFDG